MLYTVNYLQGGFNAHIRGHQDLFKLIQHLLIDLRFTRYGLGNLGEDILPANVDFSVIDEFVKVTDKDGYYSIARVSAPEIYEAEIRSSTYFLPNTKPIEIKVTPGKTTKCDIMLLSQPVVMLKFIEKNGTIILNYSLGQVGIEYILMRRIYLYLMYHRN